MILGQLRIGARQAKNAALALVHPPTNGQRPYMGATHFQKGLPLDLFT